MAKRGLMLLLVFLLLPLTACQPQDKRAERLEALLLSIYTCPDESLLAARADFESLMLQGEINAENEKDTLFYQLLQQRYYDYLSPKYYRSFTLRYSIALHSLCAAQQATLRVDSIELQPESNQYRYTIHLTLAVQNQTHVLTDTGVAQFDDDGLVRFLNSVYYTSLLQTDALSP